MTGLVPVLHVVPLPGRFRWARNGAAWMAGTSPAMTESADFCGHARPSRWLLQVDAFELMRAERALLVARHAGAHRLEHGRVGDEQFRRLFVLDLLHPLIELGAFGLIRNDARLHQQIVVLGVAPLGDIIRGGLSVR